ncbi:polar amino acid transport system substrate-binding protein [Pullulanibacillus pueri]|uniref:Basic amino acid ABC transporter substrate-binding protein n=1 Tax=Pullulanibacillus pueri TaxID=1437324 RepID=A0A8J3ELB2_9BACL|nr:basic amino acid ABC transporter substrate-binding protein [Pullulanibacillus pueri]MBM7680785.1 polar amino acid transport system substrate-binding protein [Pullulanibacillus pueri]GGH78327.1 basic amino acid ABC transporter substrate-binding protein [Pullulanibacillus pueri]
MKKGSLLFFAIIFAFIFALSACGSNKDENSSADNGGKASKKTLRVVTNAAYAPFESMDKGKIVGFDVDLIKAVAKEAGYNVKIENLGWDPMFAEIQGKNADLSVSAITINDDRKQTFDFSNPYFLSTNEILIPKDSNIASADDLKGKIVAVQNGTTGQDAVSAILGKNNKNLKKFEDNNLAIMELNKGGADAVVADNTVVEEYAKNNPDKNLKYIEDNKNFAPEYYGIMFPKGSKLKAEFNKALNTLLDNGTYAKIYKDYFGTEPDIDKLKAQAK